jgi:MFS family permease
MSSSKSSAVGVYGSAPFVGKLADSRGPRLSLTLSFFLLLTGYLGIRAVYDASEDNAKPAGGGTLFALILFEFLSGMGSDAGYFSALKTVARSFPNKIVSLSSGSTRSTTLTPLLDVADDCDRDNRFRLRIVSLYLFYDSTDDLPWEHFRLLAHASTRDGLPDGSWLVLCPPLPVSRTCSTNDHRERSSGRTR